MAPRGHVADGVVALLDLAQRVLGAAQVGRVELLGLGEQLLLGCWLASSSPVRAWSDSVRAAKKTSWAARNSFHRSSSPSRPVRGTAFQRSISDRMAALVGPQSVDVDSCCGLG